MNNLIKNRIQKQLLNFDQDIEFNKSNSVQKTIEKSIEREKWILDNMVDLGLPSGTLWMKYNIGATGDDTPESWYGNYYAWGELESKTNYSEDTYTYKDNPIILPLDHDIAYIKTNSICRMPSNEQIDELLSIQHKWNINYQGKDNLNGMLFTGSNDQTLFIPAAGYFHEDRLNEIQLDCSLWSNTINTNTNSNNSSYYLEAHANIWYCMPFYRYYGFNVRGVYNENRF